MWSFFRKNGAESDEYARVIDGFPQWSTGAPMPQVKTSDWWDELTQAQQEKLLLPIEESNNPENCVDYSDIKKKYARWFKK